MSEKCLTRDDIPIGRENAITRAALARRLGLSDRAMRRGIADLRKQQGDGYAILSTSHQPAGYWRSRDIGEINAFLQESANRARQIRLSMNDATRVLEALEKEALYPQPLCRM